MLARARDAVGGASVIAIAAGVALGLAFSRLVEVTANTVYNVQFAQPDFAGEGFVRRFAFAFGDYVLDLGPVLVSLVAFLVVLGAVVLVFRRLGS